MIETRIQKLLAALGGRRPIVALAIVLAIAFGPFVGSTLAQADDEGERNVSTTAPVGATPVSTTDLIPQRNLFQIIKAGGILMVPILFCSFITLVFVFERAIALRRGRVIPRPFVKRFLHQLSEGQHDRDKA
ncbi:MAG TPA: hypothetical protein VGX76_20160, partial [Pirellulales bacterium]|nr:hypothetical protein [Pirellulales bacterium]